MDSAKFLKVGCINNPPYIFYNNGNFYGIIISIWENIASIKKIKYELINAGGDYKKGIEGVKKKEYDILLGSTMSSFKPGKKLSFSIPILNIKLCIIKHISSNPVLLQRLLYILKKLKGYIFFGVCLLIIFIIIYSFIEHKKFLLNKSILVVGMNFLTIGAAKQPHKLKTKIYLLLITFIGLLYCTILIAILTSEFINYKEHNINANIENIDKYFYKKKFIIPNSYYLGLLQDYISNIPEFKKIDGKEIDICKYYINNKDKYDGCIVTEIAATYFKNSLKTPSIEILELDLPIQYVSIILNKEISNKYIEIINDAIISLKDNNILYNLCKLYIPFNKLLCN